MGLIWSNSGLFSTPGFVVSPVGKRERGEEKERREGGQKEIEKERKEGRRNKKGKGLKEKGIKKEEGPKGRRNSGGKEERKKKKSSAGFKPVRLVLLVFLSVKLEGVVGRILFTCLPF